MKNFYWDTFFVKKYFAPWQRQGPGEVSATKESNDRTKNFAETKERQIEQIEKKIASEKSQKEKYESIVSDYSYKLEQTNARIFGLNEDIMNLSEDEKNLEWQVLSLVEEVKTLTSAVRDQTAVTTKWKNQYQEMLNSDPESAASARANWVRESAILKNKVAEMNAKLAEMNSKRADLDNVISERKQAETQLESEKEEKKHQEEMIRANKENVESKELSIQDLTVKKGSLGEVKAERIEVQQSVNKDAIEQKTVQVAQKTEEIKQVEAQGQAIQEAQQVVQSDETTKQMAMEMVSRIYSWDQDAISRFESWLTGEEKIKLENMSVDDRRAFIIEKSVRIIENTQANVEQELQQAREENQAKRVQLNNENLGIQGQLFNIASFDSNLNSLKNAKQSDLPDYEKSEWNDSWKVENNDTQWAEKLSFTDSKNNQENKDSSLAREQGDVSINMEGEKAWENKTETDVEWIQEKNNDPTSFIEENNTMSSWKWNADNNSPSRFRVNSENVQPFSLKDDVPRANIKIPNDINIWYDQQWNNSFDLASGEDLSFTNTLNDRVLKSDNSTNFAAQWTHYAVQASESLDKMREQNRALNSSVNKLWINPSLFKDIYGNRLKTFKIWKQWEILSDLNRYYKGNPQELKRMNALKKNEEDKNEQLNKNVRVAQSLFKTLVDSKITPAYVQKTLWSKDADTLAAFMKKYENIEKWYFWDKEQLLESVDDLKQIDEILARAYLSDMYSSMLRQPSKYYESLSDDDFNRFLDIIDSSNAKWEMMDAEKREQPNQIWWDKWKEASNAIVPSVSWKRMTREEFFDPRNSERVREMIRSVENISRSDVSAAFGGKIWVLSDSFSGRVVNGDKHWLRHDLTVAWATAKKIVSNNNTFKNDSNKDWKKYYNNETIVNYGDNLTERRTVTMKNKSNLIDYREALSGLKDEDFQRAFNIQTYKGADGSTIRIANARVASQADAIRILDSGAALPMPKLNPEQQQQVLVTKSKSGTGEIVFNYNAKEFKISRDKSFPWYFFIFNNLAANPLFERILRGWQETSLRHFDDKFREKYPTEKIGDNPNKYYQVLLEEMARASGRTELIPKNLDEVPRILKKMNDPLFYRPIETDMKQKWLIEESGRITEVSMNSALLKTEKSESENKKQSAEKWENQEKWQQNEKSEERKLPEDPLAGL